MRRREPGVLWYVRHAVPWTHEAPLINIMDQYRFISGFMCTAFTHFSESCCFVQHRVNDMKPDDLISLSCFRSFISKVLSAAVKCKVFWDSEVYSQFTLRSAKSSVHLEGPWATVIWNSPSLKLPFLCTLPRMQSPDGDAASVSASGLCSLASPGGGHVQHCSLKCSH